MTSRQCVTITRTLRTANYHIICKTKNYRFERKPFVRLKMVREISAIRRNFEKNIFFWKNVSEVYDIVKDIALQPCYKFTAQKFKNHHVMLKTFKIKQLHK